ncbi:MAG: hypothetical protein K0Q68_1016 [Moraxellaceae bacterium]|nr:hypothetical protein [Moraxellaceae bacterium]
MNEHDPKPDLAEEAAKLEQEIRDDKQEMQEVGAFTVLGSVFRAWFGVQTEENRKRDFNASNPGAFIVAGVIFAVVMIVGVIIAVNLALSGAGR